MCKVFQKNKEKKKLNKNKIKFKRFQKRRDFSLLKYPLLELLDKQLPTNGNVLLYHYFLLNNNNNSYKSHVGDIGSNLKSRSRYFGGEYTCLVYGKMADFVIKFLICVH